MCLPGMVGVVLAAKVVHMTASYFDHDLIVINTTPPNHQQNRRRQKFHSFEEKWVAHPKYKAVIWDSWTYAQPSGSPMYCLFEKIKICRAHLVAWSKSAFEHKSSPNKNATRTWGTSEAGVCTKPGTYQHIEEGGEWIDTPWGSFLEVMV